MRDGVHQDGQRALILPPSPIQTDLRRILQAALRAADPALAVRRVLSRRKHILKAGPLRYDLRRIGRVVLVGAGKAAVPMAREVARIVGPRLASGCVVTQRSGAARMPRIKISQAGHPVPDPRGVRAARRIRAIASALDPDDLLIVLLSGGASSLLPLPANGLTLADKQKTTRLLLHSGATIAEVNAVRKHLSAIKAGRLAQATRARILTLMLSDVEGDDPGTIGSGPTAPDRTTFQDAVRIVRRYGLWERLPLSVRVHLVEGLAGWQSETPKPRNTIFRRVDHLIIGNNRLSVEAAAAAARRAGYETLILQAFVTGEAATLGRLMGEWGKDLVQRLGLAKPLCLIAGGELTVTVRGKGLGGRAQEFALAAALALHGAAGVWVIGIGTDGRDGPTDAAGAIVDGGTVARGRRRGLDAQAYLRRNDSYAFFKRAGGHIVTGPTGTNVNDLYLVLIRPLQARLRRLRGKVTWEGNLNQMRSGRVRVVS